MTLTELFRLVIRGDRTEGRTVEVASHHLPCTFPQPATDGTHQHFGNWKTNADDPTSPTTSGVDLKPPLPPPRNLGSSTALQQRVLRLHRASKGRAPDAPVPKCDDAEPRRHVSVISVSSNDDDAADLDAIYGDDFFSNSNAANGAPVNKSAATAELISEMKGNCSFWISKKNQANLERCGQVTQSGVFGSEMAARNALSSPHSTEDMIPADGHKEHFQVRYIHLQFFHIFHCTKMF